MGARMSWHRVTFFFVLAGRKYLAWNCEPWSVTFRNARPRSTWSPVYIPILAALTSLKYMNVLRIVTDLSRHKIVTIWMVPLSPPTLKVRSPLIVFCCLSYIYDGHFVTSHCITHTTSYWEVIENLQSFLAELAYEQKPPFGFDIKLCWRLYYIPQIWNTAGSIQRPANFVVYLNKSAIYSYEVIIFSQCAKKYGFKEMLFSSNCARFLKERPQVINFSL